MLLTHPTQIPLQDLDTELTIDNLPVRGTLPPWLQGTLIRNGPAKFHFGNKKINHWFDGLAMLHAFTFGEGRVAYRNRFLRSTAYHQTMEHGNLRFMGFAQDPCKSVFKRLFAYFFPSLTPKVVQNANVNVMRVAEHYVALTETPLPVCFDLRTLQTLGPLNFKDPLCKSDCFESAHPHHDQTRAEVLNFQITFGKACTYTLFTIPDQGTVSRKPFFEMQTDRASYMHTFALTGRYAILVEFPLVVNPLDLVLRGGGYISQFQWAPERNTRFHVIDRTQGKRVRSYETDPFFCFHHVNAYEEKETIVLDLIRYPDAQIVYGDPPHDQKRTLQRYRLGSSIHQETLAESALELPRIHYQRYNGAPYTFVYGVGFKYPEKVQDNIPILKVDVSNGQVREWSEEGSLAGEPVFVARPNAKDEDDGVLLSLVTNERKGISFLLVLEAKNLQEIARAEVAQRIPYGLHGMFFH